MDRREFVQSGAALLLAGCGSGADEMPQEFTIQQSPKFRTTKQAFDFGVEGIWVPVLTFETPGDLVVAYATQVGRYVRHLNEIRCAFYIVTNTFTHTTAALDCRIAGLPFTSGNPETGALFSEGSLAFQGITKANYTQFIPYVPAATDRIQFLCSGQGQGVVDLQTGDMPTGVQKVLIGSVTYTTSN